MRNDELGDRWPVLWQRLGPAQLLPDSRLQPGFTLLECLIAISIIGVLLALLLPSIQAAREASRNASCKNNLKQIGLSLLQFECSQQTLPVGAQSRITFGVSWWVRVMPYMEETAGLERFDSRGAHSGSVLLHPTNGALVDGLVPAPLYCPSSPIPALKSISNFRIMTPSYVGISGASSDGGFPESRVNRCCVPEDRGEISAGGILVPNRAVQMRQVTDGTSNTLAVGEASDYLISSGARYRIDGGSPVGWITGTTAVGTPPDYMPEFAPPCWNITTVRYPPNMRDYGAPGVHSNRGANNPLVSAHPGGVNCLLLDGSVRFCADEIDIWIFKQLATRDAGRTGGLRVAKETW